MEKVLEVVRLVLEKGPEYLTAVEALLMALIAFFLLIPGEQPEKFLRSVVDFISKFSKKSAAAVDVKTEEKKSA